MSALILVIEDNPESMELASYLLRCAGYRALTAADGAEGVCIARREKPDLIASDLQMPVLDGFGVLKEVRTDPVLASIPVVAVTALSMLGDRQKILNAGFDGYISKPIDPSVFVAQLEAHLKPELRRQSPR